MAKILVEKNICDACGADVRAGSLFCYNCGGAVSEQMPAAAATNNNRKNDTGQRFQSDPAENNDLKTTQLQRETIDNLEMSPIGKPVGKPPADKTFEKGEVQPEPDLEAAPETSSIQDQAKLKSAANLRRKAKSFQKKTVEVVWEEPETAPNKWFPIVAIFLILLVVGIYYLAMYLK